MVVTSNGIARFAPQALLGDMTEFSKQHQIKISTGALCRFDHGGMEWRCTMWNRKPQR